MVVNRYTNVSVPRYTPRTLQEYMMVPAYKREQHNAVDEVIASSQTELAKFAAAAEHDDALKMEQARLNENLNKQAELLASEGFTPASKSNFLNFNKDYQSSIGPSGTIGKIQAAKAALEQQEADYIKNASAAGFPTDKLGLNWENHRKAYADKFEKTGKIENINPLYAPKYYNPVEEVDKRATLMGVSTRDLGNIVSSIVPSEDGSSYVLTEGWENAIGGDQKQAAALATWITNQINNPESGIGQSLAHEGKSPEAALEEIKGLTDVYASDSVRKRSSSEISGRMAAPKADGADPAKSFYTHSSQTTPIGDNYDAMEVNADNTLSAPDASNTDIAKARATKNILATVDEELSTNGEFVGAKDRIAAIYQSPEFLALPEETQKMLQDGKSFYTTSSLNPLSILTERSIAVSGPREEHDIRPGDNWNVASPDMSPAQIQRNALSFVDKYGDELEDSWKTINTLRDTNVASKGFERTTIVVPFDKTATNSVNMLNAIQAYTKDNIKPSEVIFNEADGTNRRLDVNEDSRGKAVTLFQNADASDIKSIHAAKQGTQAGFVITFNPKKGSSLNPSNAYFDEAIFTGVESLEMFVPVNRLNDPLTGARATESMFIDLLPAEVQKEMRKFITTADISSTPNVSELGRPNTKVNQFFMNSPENLNLDFLQVNAGSSVTGTSEKLSRNKGKYFVPYMIEGDKKVPFNWNSFIPQGDLKQQEAFVRNFDNSGAYDILLNNVLTDPAIVKKFGVELEGPINIELLEYIRDKEVRLNNTSDIHTLGLFHNISTNLKK